MIYPHLLMASVAGMSIKEMADRLGINYRTVQQRMKAMGLKTHVLFVPARDHKELFMAIDDCLREWFEKQVREQPIGALLPNESTNINRLFQGILDRLNELDELDEEKPEVSLSPGAEEAVRGIIEHGSLSAAAQGDPARKASMSSLLRRSGIRSLSVAMPDECADKIRELAMAKLREVLDAGD